MKVELRLGVCLLVACGGGSKEEPRQPGQSTEAEAGDAVPAEAVPEDIAGGETSEFSGDIGNCPEIASSEPLDLDDPEVAPWVALADGHHELTLGWKRHVLSEAVTGFEEHTRVSIDVTVLQGRDVVYGTGGSTHPAFAECNGQRARQLELDVELETADGAVIASFREWYEPQMYDEEATLEVGRMHPDRNRDGAEFSGSLELGLDPALGGTTNMWVSLSFGNDSLRGGFSPEVSLRDAEYIPGRSSWTPISASFPDDACQGNGGPIGLDDVVASLDGTPRTHFQRVVEAWERAPIPAVWTAAPYGTALPGVEAPPPTELSLSLGEPTLACLSGDWALVHAPLTVVTADGRINLTQPIVVELFGNNGSGGDIRTPWIPAADFSAQLGLSGVNLDPGSYGGIDIRSSVDFQDDRVSGMLTVRQWDAFTETPAAYPALVWCEGTNCVVEPER